MGQMLKYVKQLAQKIFSCIGLNADEVINVKRHGYQTL
jgi:hypothetical protein